MEASDQERQDVHPQLPGRQEGSTVESAYLAVQGAGPFRENDHGIAFGHHLPDMRTVDGQPPGGREIAGFADYRSIEGELPDPVVGHKDEFGLQGNEGQHIQVTLVIADIHGRLGEILSVRVLHGILAAGNGVHRPAGHAAHHLVKGRSLREKQGQDGQHRHPDPHHKGYVHRGQHTGYGKRLRTLFSVLEVQPAVDDGRQVAGHGHHRNHSYHRHQAQRFQGRMLGKHQHAYANEHNDGTQHHGVAIGVKNLLSGFELVFQPLGNEDAVVISHTKDKGGQNNVDDIELQARQAHNSPDPNPAHGQRQEGNERKFQRAETDPQEDEHNKAANQADGIEILRKGAH